MSEPRKPRRRAVGYRYLPKVDYPHGGSPADAPLNVLMLTAFDSANGQTYYSLAKRVQGAWRSVGGVEPVATFEWYDRDGRATNVTRWWPLPSEHGGKTE